MIRRNHGKRVGWILQQRILDQMLRFAKKADVSSKHIVALLCVCVAMSGCMHSRFVVATDVPSQPVGGMRTRYKYTIFGGSLDYQLWLNGSSNPQQHRHNDFVKACPDVFVDDGIPIVVDSRDIKNETWDPFGYRSCVATSENVPKRLLYVLGLGLVPATYGSQTESRCTVRLLSSSTTSDSFMEFKREDNCFSPAFYMGPYPLLFYNGMPDMDGFDAQTIRKTSNSGIGSSGDVGIHEEFALEREVVAHAVAFRLKEMEDSGQITDAMWQQALEGRKTRSKHIAKLAVKRINDGPDGKIVREPQVQTPAYSLESLEWDEDNDYACSFVVKMKGECSLEAFFEVQAKFERSIREYYCRNHRKAKEDSLVVVVRPNLNNGQIEGRAEVLTITPTSLSYDANTRRGKLSVRFNAGQAEEARKWIRTNIETLARDKNIALTTEQQPPQATYYLLGEKVEGNVMEIEFKTE